MKQLATLLFLLSGLGLTGLAQNLIPDPGFELSKSIASDSYWMSPNQASPDLIEEGQLGYGSAIACRGKKSAGIILYDEDNPAFREYLMCRILQPLHADSCYELSMWIQPSAHSYYLTDGFGAWLGTEAVHLSQEGILAVRPQWKQGRMELLGEIQGWNQLKFRIKARGGEQFLILGNFNQDEQTLLRIRNRKSLYRLAYIQLDEIQLTPCYASSPMGEGQTSQTHVRKGNLFVPHVVTPNGDGFNDELFIPGLPAYTSIRILDSKGTEVFRERVYQNNWNGSGCLSGKYQYELVLPDGNIVYGSFELVRRKANPPPRRAPGKSGKKPRK